MNRLVCRNCHSVDLLKATHPNGVDYLRCRSCGKEMLLASLGGETRQILEQLEKKVEPKRIVEKMIPKPITTAEYFKSLVQNGLGEFEAEWVKRDAQYGTERTFDAWSEVVIETIYPGEFENKLSSWIGQLVGKAESESYIFALNSLREYFSGINKMCPPESN